MSSVGVAIEFSIFGQRVRYNLIARKRTWTRTSEDFRVGQGSRNILFVPILFEICVSFFVVVVEGMAMMNRSELVP